jgi:crotonobetainyl-CoA:carnitine CoA-transferase CaiB-like acyl-CoA transferase
MTPTALANLRVIELATEIAGPFCGKMLADYGADVIKVEPPGGDPARHCDGRPEEETSSLFTYLNANKRSIVLDLDEPADVERFKALVATADLLIEDGAPGELAARGLSADELLALRPSLVVTSITPYGQDGPYANRKASDLVLQAASSWMSFGGEADREPLMTGGSITWYITGTSAAAASMAAIHYAKETGTGQQVDIAAIEALAKTCGPYPTAASYGDTSFVRKGLNGYPAGIFACTDGYVAVNLLTQDHWEMLVAFMGAVDLLDDPELATPTLRHRTEQQARIGAAIASFAAGRTVAEMMSGQEFRIPITPVPTIAEIPELQLHEARGYLVDVDTPDGHHRQPGQMFVMSETPWSLSRPAPELGADEPDVLGREPSSRV